MLTHIDSLDEVDHAARIAGNLVEGKSPYFETLYVDDAMDVAIHCLHRGAEVHISRTALGGFNVVVPHEEDL